MNRRQIIRVLAAGAAIVMLLPAPAAVIADSLPPGETVMQRVNARSRGAASRMRLEMVLRDSRRGTFRKTIAAERQRLDSGHRTAYRITSPDHERGIALLLSEDREQRGMWMYFPAAQQVVRVVSRGLPALATDFTCEDLLVTLPLTDYRFRTVAREQVDGADSLRVEMTPASDRLQQELGFATATGWVREDNWTIVQASYRDGSGEVFKRFSATRIERVQGVWTVRAMRMQNLRAQHETEVRVVEVDYSSRFAKERFRPETFGTIFGAPAM